jgi:hypothetical protein
VAARVVGRVSPERVAAVAALIAIAVLVTACVVLYGVMVQ